MTGARHFAKQRERQRDAMIRAMQPAGFADAVRGAIVAVPVLAVTADARVRAYVSSVLRPRQGVPGDKVVRVSVYGPDGLVALYTRTRDGWEF